MIADSHTSPARQISQLALKPRVFYIQLLSCPATLGRLKVNQHCLAVFSHDKVVLIDVAVLDPQSMQPGQSTLAGSQVIWGYRMRAIDVFHDEANHPALLCDVAK